MGQVCLTLNEELLTKIEESAKKEGLNVQEKIRRLLSEAYELGKAGQTSEPSIKDRDIGFIVDILVQQSFSNSVIDYLSLDYEEVLLQEYKYLYLAKNAVRRFCGFCRVRGIQAIWEEQKDGNECSGLVIQFPEGLKKADLEKLVNK